MRKCVANCCGNSYIVDILMFNVIAYFEYDPILITVRIKLLFTWQRLTQNVILTRLISNECAHRHGNCTSYAVVKIKVKTDTAFSLSST